MMTAMARMIITTKTVLFANVAEGSERRRYFFFVFLGLTIIIYYHIIELMVR